MSLDRALQTALHNNPDLLATLEELGVAQADVETAGLASNPEFDGSIGFSNGAGLQNTPEYGVSYDFLSLALRGLRQRVAGTRFLQTEARVAEAVADTDMKVRQAYYQTAAQQQIVVLEEAVLTASEGASDLAQQQFQAGNISRLDYDRQKAEMSAIRIDLARGRSVLQQTRRRLLALMGQPAGVLPVVADLPGPPEHPPDEAGLEQQAVRQRGVMAVARLEPQALEHELNLERREGGLGEVRVGFDRVQEVDGSSETGPTLKLNLPVFNHNQGQVKRLEAQIRQSHLRAQATELQVRSEVQDAFAQLEAAGEEYRLLIGDIVPLRGSIVAQSQLYTNNMQLSVYALLSDRQAEAQSRRQALEAQRDYWIASAALGRAAATVSPQMQEVTK